MIRRPLCVAVLLAGVGCTDNPTAPGRCPDFCPPGRITIVDTLLTDVIVRDTAFGPYIEAKDAITLVASELPGVISSRPVIRFQTAGRATRLGTDTASYPFVGADSARFSLSIVRYDSTVRNLRLQVYRLPASIDSTTTFAAVNGVFTGAPVRVINVDSLVRTTNKKDTVTKDSVFLGANGSIRVLIKLDSVGARYIVADSGVSAYGIRVAGDTATTVTIGGNDSPDPPLVVWYLQVDSLGTTARSVHTVAPAFDSYVLDPPFPAIDSTLAVGGIPSVRSLLRVALPRGIRDSTQILRATLQLVPAAPARGAPIDTFTLVANAVAADLGGKSPLSSGLDSSFFGTGTILMNSTDTVRVEITRILRRWAADTLLPPAFFLLSASEGIVLPQIRFHPSKNAAFKPSVLITYTGRFPFGIP